MSTFEDDQYRWRETYFVLFSAAKRPTLRTVEKKLSAINRRYVLTNLSADEDGQFESLTLISPDDFAALDVCYTSGPEVVDQAAELFEELRGVVEPEQQEALHQIKRCDGRFDVLHFEQVSDEPLDDDDELLDPGTLLGVLQTLASITGGIAVDPQSGTILGNDD